MQGSRRTKKIEPESGLNWQTWLGALAIFAILTLALYYIYSRPVTSADYEGKIVDRWADQAPSTQATRPHFHLVVESAAGKRFTVEVDPNVYESARVGMRIRSKNGQAVLIDSP